MSTGTIAREVAKIVADVLGAELDLDPAHCLLGDQEWNIPTDKKLFLVVFDQSGPTIGAANYLETDPSSVDANKEIQQANSLHSLRIEIMSFNGDARTRKEEVGLALASIRALQAAEAAGIQIGRAQAPVDASETETTRRLLKFVVRVNVTALHQKIKAPPGAGFYDKFNGATADGSAKSPEVNTQ